MSVLQQHGATRVLQLFCSYAREDREGVRALLDGVRHLRHQVWVDERLSGGQAWWDEILAQLRKCDAMLIAVSPALLESQASALERQYGSRVGKPLLPVIIRPVLADLLPPDLAPLQAIDYTAPGPNAAFELAGALYSLPPARPLPDPLPDPPPVPISYLSGLSDRVRAATLTLDDQLAVVARLRTAMERPREREAAVELLEALRQRTDLYHVPAVEIDKLLRERPAAAAARPVEATREAPKEERRREPASDVPPGWYPDPSGRHELRYFDADWTRWASDRGTVVDDPDF
jgi:TIR domain